MDKPPPPFQKTRSGLAPENFQRRLAGRQTGLFVLQNNRGEEVCLTNYGARIVSWLVPGRDGSVADIVLGFDTLDAYLASPEPYFGAAIGRFANRIACGRFALDGIEHRLALNDGPNTLHGGPGGFHSRVWDVLRHDARSVEFALLSPHGDQGFPGNLRVRLQCELADDGALSLVTTAETDRLTVVNFTNHSFFNLNGAGSGDIDGHILAIRAGHYTPVDDHLIPTGEIAPVAGTPFDFRDPAPIAGRLGRNLILDGQVAADGLRHAARVIAPESGRILDVLTNQPGLQLYCGQLLDGAIKGKGGLTYGRRSALCLEPQHFPDSPNHPSFPSTQLRPSTLFRHICVYRS
ncbi:MAG: galactose mutarotase [Opitutaceae bacterium]|jgi:aldose 1-epimerase|nr:galactose mutarotase [Opitutaceae bacterium]